MSTVGPEIRVSGSLADKLDAILNIAARAPSAHNMQPWAVARDGDRLRVYRDPDWTLQVGDPTRRQTFLGIGMLIEAICIAARRWGVETRVTVIADTPNDLEVAVIDVREGVEDPSSDSLYGAIWRRHTNRGPYAPTLSRTLLAGLRSDDLDPVTVFELWDDDSRQQVGSLVGEGMALALQLPAMRRELVDLCSREADQATIGLVIEAMATGVPDDISVAEWASENLDPHLTAEHLAGVYSTTPLIIVLATERDDPAAWIAAGRLGYRILLMGASEGLSHCISAAPIEVPTLTPRLRTILKTSERPQLLLRVGDPLEPGLSMVSRRRPLSLA